MLSQITEQLSNANAEIAKLDAALAEYPNDLSIQMMLSSVRKHRSILEEEFAAESNRAGVDICNYRMFGIGEAVAANLFQALVRFQSLFSLTYAAIAQKAPKTTRHIGKEFVESSTFGFSHSYVGSSGFVLTIPNERLLLSTTDLDEAISAIFEMTKLQDSKSIREFASQLGIGVIRELYAWSKTHTSPSLGADIDWMRKDKVLSSVFVEPQSFGHLESLIDETSDEIEETLSFTGYLRGADVSAKTFRFESDDGKTIRGTFSDAIDEHHEVTIPHHRYCIEVAMKTVVHYSYDQPDVNFFLKSIEPI